jgi:hypothetical protein
MSMSIYEPLKNYLANLKQDNIRMAFMEIEKILGFSLPKSAYTYIAWWANGGHSQAKAWLGAGYKVNDLDMIRKSVVFLKTGAKGNIEKKAVINEQSSHTQVTIVSQNFPKADMLQIQGYEFHFVQHLNPALNGNGEIKKYYPQGNYDNTNGLPLSRFGGGAFCKFSIQAEDWPGVYLWVVDGEIIYIGETVGLRRRFNTGYGNISPRNCYVGGQNTNCKMNKIVLDLYEQGKVISLYFYNTPNYKQVELHLLKKINTKYNVKDN